jgi:SsrA-binding protein
MTLARITRHGRMNNPQPKVRSGDKVVAQNRKARHEYHILQTWEAGVVLQGTEVKSLRDGKANLSDAFARLDHRGEMWLHNMHVSPYEQANRFNHDPLRPRKLLLHRSELRKLVGQVEQKGLTMVPLDVHFSNGIAKVTVALVRGKKLHDKRETLKERAVARDNDRGFKEA